MLTHLSGSLLVWKQEEKGRRAKSGEMWTWATEPLEGQRHAQGPGVQAGDSEVLVLLVPGQMQVTSDTSFITGNISEGCMGPRLGAGPGCDPLFPGKKYSLQIMKGTHGGLESWLNG